MTVKPEHVFDREQEWAGLDAFAANPYPGAMLGVVSGRRRQGKSFLLEALTTATGGLYFPAVEATEAVSLRAFTGALVAAGRPAQPTRYRTGTMRSALLFSAVTGEPRVVVIDEFPFLVKANPSLPSIIQRELGPGGAGQRVSGTAAALRVGDVGDGATCWPGRRHCADGPALNCWCTPSATGMRRASGMPTDPELAVLLHAVVGGTPAYRREFVAFDVPDGRDDFDAWVLRTVLNRQSPLFREARYLLAEETEIRDPGLYHSVLAAIASGNQTNGGIANYVGRKSGRHHPSA